MNGVDTLEEGLVMELMREKKLKFWMEMRYPLKSLVACDLGLHDRGIW
jgi:hypothetical protein